MKSTPIPQPFFNCATNECEERTYPADMLYELGSTDIREKGWYCENCVEDYPDTPAFLGDLISLADRLAEVSEHDLREAVLQ